VAKDIDSYLRELQAALASAGADPALVQDALFDAEEYLRAEVATGSAFATVADSYGTPAEVAAAYLGAAPPQEAPAQAAAGAVPGAAGTPSVAPTPPTPPAPPGWAPAPPYGQAPGYGQAPYYGPTPPGVQAGMAAATAGAGAAPSVWRQIFGVFVDPAAYKALVYMILSLATGVTYFTIVVTGVTTAGSMLVLIVGVPLFLLVLGMVRAMALFEGKLVEGLLGTRMPRRERAAPPNMNLIQRMVFWVKDGRTWASMAYMILMLPLGIVYFTVAVTGLSAGLWGIASVGWGWFGRFGGWDYVSEGVTYHWALPAWGIPLAMIGGVIVLVGMMHLIRAIGRLHAAFAKSMLVRLAK
jgi:hypothetical protein